MAVVAAENFLFPSNLSVYVCYVYFLQVEALTVQLSQREGELIQEKTEVKKLATFLKQVEHSMC